MWSGQTDAAIETLELAQRIDPELNPIDRFALSLAYYLKGRYDAAIEQGELNLRKTSGANYSRIVLAAAYAEQNRTDDTARVVTMIHHIDPAFDSREFGTKFSIRSISSTCATDCARPASRPTRPAAPDDRYSLGRIGRCSFALAMFAARSFWKSTGPAGAALPKT